MLDRPTPLHRDRLEMLVRDLIVDNLAARPDRIKDSFREAGLTSLDTVKLVLGIEREFGIIVGPDDFDPENFETLDALDALVRRLAA